MDLTPGDGFSASFASLASDVLNVMHVVCNCGQVTSFPPGEGPYVTVTYLQIPASVLTGISDRGAQIPEHYGLSQNYPNPFNPTTTFSFAIPYSSIVNLTIFNLLGEQVATLVSGRMDAGTHTIQWDAIGQPSGVYFYRLRARQTDGGQAGEFVETRKLVLLR